MFLHTPAPSALIQPLHGGGSRTARAVLTFVLIANLLAASTAGASVKVSVDAGELNIRSVGSERNVVDVRFRQQVYVVHNATSTIDAGMNCLDLFLGATSVCAGEITSASVQGSDGDDVIDLSEVPVRVVADAEAGDDAIDGGMGPNILAGGDGVDQLVGNSADDQLDGEGGDDLLVGGSGKDTAFGGNGADILKGGDGTGDVLFGEADADLLLGGPGEDFLQGGAGPDALAGGAGRDTLAPGTGDDDVFGGIADRDRLECPVDLQQAETAPQPCADVMATSIPDVWPPLPTSAASAVASLRRANAWPITQGDATKVRVHIPAKQRRKVTVCIRTTARGGRRHKPYTARTWTKHYPVVKNPDPNPSAFTATLRIGACRR